MQDALTTATDKKSYVREIDGQAFYTYEVAGTVSPCWLHEQCGCISPDCGGSHEPARQTQRAGQTFHACRTSTTLPL